MELKPIFMRTKEEIAHIFPAGSLQREQALKALEHSFSMYDYNGNHKPHPYEKENLLEVISRRDMYVVDTNSDWKRECEGHPDKAFILSPPLARENPNTIDLILDKARCRRGNIFSVGVYAQIERVLIDKIDEHYRYCFDIDRLSEASRGKGPTVATEKAKIWNHIEQDKSEIRPIIEAEKASDLPPPEQLQIKINVFKSEIKRLLPECRHNVHKSRKMAILCYSTLLMEDDQPRKDEGTRFEFDCPQYENVFNDMYIVLGAIYLGAFIMTIDRKLTQMASYAGVKCSHVAQRVKPT